MYEDPRTYPLLRGRRGRRRGRRRVLPARRLALGGLALAIILAGAAFFLLRDTGRPDSASELILARDAMARGNYSAARNHALSVDGTPAEVRDAQVILSRAYLALGEYIAAEGAANRAVIAGAAVSIVRPMLAEAWIGAGDPARALSVLREDRTWDGARVRALALAASGDIPAARLQLETLLADVPQDVAAWRDLARIRLDAGDIGGATDAARNALASRPADPRVALIAGEIVRSRYGPVAAIPWFEAALSRDAYLHDALIARAAALGDTDRYRAMLGATRRALAARPDSVQARYLRAVLAARAGDLGLARTLLERIAGRGDGVPGVLLLSGAIDYTMGAPEQAAARWGELVARQPMNITARRLLGLARLRAGDAGGALAELRPVALRADADAYTLSLVARAFEAQGERDWAARFLDRAARAGASVATPAPFGSDVPLSTSAAAIVQTAGDPVVAVRHVRGLVETGAIEAAVREARAMVAAGPGAPAAHILLGDLLTVQGAWGPAFDAYRRAADLRFDASTMLRLVEAAHRSGHLREGAEVLALFLSQNPADLGARRLLASRQIAARDWPRSAATLEGLRIATGNEDAAILIQLAVAREETGDAETARTHNASAARLFPPVVTMRPEAARSP